MRCAVSYIGDRSPFSSREIVDLFTPTAFANSLPLMPFCLRAFLNVVAMRELYNRASAESRTIYAVWQLFSVGVPLAPSAPVGRVASLTHEGGFPAASGKWLRFDAQATEEAPVIDRERQRRS